MQYLLKTLGCKANLYDSQLLEAELKRRGWTPAADDAAALCIVNSCSVTDEADRETRRLAARLARKNPQARVVVTGCAAEIDPERLAHSRGVHYVIGNRDKPRLVDLVLKELEKPAPENGGGVLGVAENYAEMISRHPIDREWPLPELSADALGAAGSETSRTRAFLKIQEGCNAFCTYCVIPYGRGPSRSLDVAVIVEQVRGLVEQGIQEVIITGTNIGDYGLDWSETPRLGQLLREIFAQTEISRLRVSSLDPVEIDDEIFSLMESEPRFCPHFHVSLQSPHSRILKLMKRKYDASHVERCLKRIAGLSRRTFVGMDLITGFPGETRDEFAWGVEALRGLPWSRLHVFPYSERAGTPATRLPGVVPETERKERASVLRRLSLERMTEHYQQALAACGGRLDQVLFERGNSGYTPDYLRVVVSEGVAANQLRSVRPVSVESEPASGEAFFKALML